MTLFWAKLIWILGVIGWFAIRYPHDRRSRLTPRTVRADRRRELVLLIISAIGMLVVPFVFVLTGWPQFADYQFRAALAWLGIVVFTCSLLLFYRTHQAPGRGW